MLVPLTLFVVSLIAQILLFRPEIPHVHHVSLTGEMPPPDGELQVDSSRSGENGTKTIGEKQFAVTTRYVKGFTASEVTFSQWLFVLPRALPGARALMRNVHAQIDFFDRDGQGLTGSGSARWYDAPEGSPPDDFVASDALTTDFGPQNIPKAFTVLHKNTVEPFVLSPQLGLVGEGLRFFFLRIWLQAEGVDEQHWFEVQNLDVASPFALHALSEPPEVVGSM